MLVVYIHWRSRSTYSPSCPIIQSAVSSTRTIYIRCGGLHCTVVLFFDQQQQQQQTGDGECYIFKLVPTPYRVRKLDRHSLSLCVQLDKIKGFSLQKSFPIPMAEMMNVTRPIRFETMRITSAERPRDRQAYKIASVLQRDVGMKLQIIHGELLLFSFFIATLLFSYELERRSREREREKKSRREIKR